MHCFSLGAIEHFLIWLVVVLAVLAIIRVFLGLMTGGLSGQFAWAISAAVEIVKIVLYAIVCIAIIVVIFMLLACVVPL